MLYSHCHITYRQIKSCFVQTDLLILFRALQCSFIMQANSQLWTTPASPINSAPRRTFLESYPGRNLLPTNRKHLLLTECAITRSYLSTIMHADMCFRNETQQIQRLADYCRLSFSMVLYETQYKNFSSHSVA